MKESKTTIGEAETLDYQLRLIRRHMLRSFDADRAQAGLTASQTQVLAILSRDPDGRRKGLTIGALKQHMGLSQSTVSELIERLERTKLVLRKTDPSDRRRTLVCLTEPVREYLGRDYWDRRLKPLVDVLEKATEEQRSLIQRGISTLLTLLSDQATSEAASLAQADHA